MDLRRVVVIGLLLAPLVAFYGGRWWTSDERDEERRYAEAVEPARLAIASLRLDGFAPCAEPAQTYARCFRGVRDVRATAAEVEAHLRRVAVRDVSLRCRDLADRAFCVVSGRLAGGEVHGSVGRPATDARRGEAEVRLSVAARSS